MSGAALPIFEKSKNAQVIPTAPGGGPLQIMAIAGASADDHAILSEAEQLRVVGTMESGMRKTGLKSLVNLDHHARRHMSHGVLDEVFSPRPVATRWGMLFYLSALALLSDWICFSGATIAELIQRNFSMHDSNLVTCFLATNVAFCLLEPGAVRKFGLRAAIVGGAFLMAAGCALRYLACVLARPAEANVVGAEEPGTTPPLPRLLLLIGTMLVGAAQPFFQCTPSLLAANWFGESETTFAATVALNANQLGIAASYAFGATSVHSDESLRRYFLGIFVVSAVLALGSWRHFEERPLKPPSYSQLVQTRRRVNLRQRDEVFNELRADSERLSFGLSLFGPPRTNSIGALTDGTSSPATSRAPTENGDSDDEGDADSSVSEPKRPLRVRRWLVTTRRVGHGAVELTRDFWASTRSLRAVRGFDACVVGFVASIVASNIFSTFLPHLVLDSEQEMSKSESQSLQYGRVAYLGAGFQLAIMAGSITIGAAVDVTKAYKTATLVAFTISFATLCVITDRATHRNLLDVSILALGFFVGPIQPLTAELAVEVTYPDGDENAIVALQQTCGNLASAAAVPIFLHAQRLAHFYNCEDAYSIRAEYAMLILMIILSALFFCTVLPAPLKRTEVNSANSARRDLHLQKQALKKPRHHRSGSAPSAYMTF